MSALGWQTGRPKTVHPSENHRLHISVQEDAYSNRGSCIMAVLA